MHNFVKRRCCLCNRLNMIPPPDVHFSLLRHRKRLTRTGYCRCRIAAIAQFENEYLRKTLIFSVFSSTFLRRGFVLTGSQESFLLIVVFMTVVVKHYATAAPGCRGFIPQRH